MKYSDWDVDYNEKVNLRKIRTKLETQNKLLAEIAKVLIKINKKVKEK